MVTYVYAIINVKLDYCECELICIDKYKISHIITPHFLYLIICFILCSSSTL